MLIHEFWLQYGLYNTIKCSIGYKWMASEKWRDR